LVLSNGLWSVTFFSFSPLFLLKFIMAKEDRVIIKKELTSFLTAARLALNEAEVQDMKAFCIRQSSSVKEGEDKCRNYLCQTVSWLLHHHLKKEIDLRTGCIIRKAKE